MLKQKQSAQAFVPFVKFVFSKIKFNLCNLLTKLFVYSLICVIALIKNRVLTTLNCHVETSLWTNGAFFRIIHNNFTTHISIS